MVPGRQLRVLSVWCGFVSFYAWGANNLTVHYASRSYV